MFVFYAEVVKIARVDKNYYLIEHISGNVVMYKII